MTSVTLAHGTIVELYPDSPPALVIPRLNSRVSITAFDAAVVCSLAADTCRRSNEISPDLFAMLASAGTVTPLQIQVNVGITLGDSFKAVGIRSSVTGLVVG